MSENIEQNEEQITPQSTEEAAVDMRANMGAVKLSFRWVGTQKKLSDNQMQQAASSFNATADLVTASKRLFDTKRESYRALTTLKSQATSYWRAMTLPFPQDGLRLIKQNEVEKFEEKMRDFQERLAQAASNLQLEYEEIKQNAREKLGDLYNPNDYPASLENMFAISWEYPSIDAPDYLLRYNPSLYRQEQKRVQEKFETAVLMAENAFAEKLEELVDHLIERLTDSTDGGVKVFRKSAVENFKEFYENFRHMNVNSNQELERLIKRAADITAGVDVKALRDRRDLRQNLTTQMSSVKSALNQLITDAPARRVVPMTTPV
jgi:hypothetical protein